MAQRTTLNGREVLDEGLDDWRYLLRALHTRLATGDFATGLRLVERVGAAAEEADHHPDLDLRYTHLNITLASHDAGGVTARDLRLARRISEIAAEEGVAAAPSAVSVLEIGLDTADMARIKPFWKAVLGLADSGNDDDLVDPHGAVPSLWFQPTEPHDEPRQRFHLDITVPHDQVDARLAAALAAGGTLVTDAYAPSFWVLADADGNKVCICTWQDRDGAGHLTDPAP